MKRYIHSAIILLAALSLTGCSKTEEFEHNPDNALQIESVSGISPFALMQEPASKAVITGETLPSEEAGNGIGLFVTATDGTAYDCKTTGYSNVKYAYSSEKWSATSPIYLSNTTGKLYGYFPYNVDAANLTAIPVVSSLNGTDYLYATSQDVSFSNKSVNLQMNHALARLHLTIKKGDKYLSDCSLTKIVLQSKAIDANGTMDITTGTITATKAADATGTFELTGSDAVTTAGIEKDILLVPADNSEGKKDITLTLTIDGVDAEVKFTADKGLDIRSGIQCNATLTIEDTGIKVTGVGVGVWGDGGSQSVEVEGHKVTVKFDEGAPGIEENVLVTAYAKNGDVIIKSFSSNGKKLSFRRNDTETILGIAPQDNIYNIVLSEVKQDITVTIDYFLNSNPEFTTISGHKVSVVLDADTDILKGISIDNGKLVIEAESSSGKPVKCVKDEEKITGSKTGTLYKFTISDITDDATVTIGYSKYTATIGFTQDSVTDKATLKINGDEVEAGGSTSVLEGTDVEYSALADDGYLVFGWYDNDGQKISDAESFTVSGISSDVAYYAEVKAGYKLKVNTISAGTSTIAANGVSIESGRAYYYDPNTQITLTASPATGCQFVEWCDADGKTLSIENPYSVTLTSSLTITAVFVPKNALSGVFSVSGNKKVRFSKGNLWYGKVGDASEATFNFEANQYDVPPLTNEKETDSHVGHFYWSEDANVARSLSNYTDSGASATDVFFTNDSENQAKPNLGFSVNGQTGFWRVLSGGTNGEWFYLLNSRNTAYGSNRRYAAVKVNGMAGLLIFPDDFSSWPSKDAGTEPQTFNTNSNNWNERDYTVDQFNTLQNNGCVFLPAAGYRNGGYGTAGVSNVGNDGYYWSASPLDDYGAYDLSFFSGDVDPSRFAARDLAQSVRLVTESK